MRTPPPQTRLGQNHGRQRTVFWANTYLALTQMLAAGRTLLPVINGQTGADPIFQGATDFDLDLIESRTLNEASSW